MTILPSELPAPAKLCVRRLKFLCFDDERIAFPVPSRITSPASQLPGYVRSAVERDNSGLAVSHERSVSFA